LFFSSNIVFIKGKKQEGEKHRPDTGKTAPKKQNKWKIKKRQLH